ncbi:MAG: AAA family ATPase [Hydrogenophaga sp.]|nr:AAA family ATPase [Hydrogenophaga sp.]MDP3926324.1 AAA family ATPase [Hydrogenophaga sp.]
MSEPAVPPPAAPANPLRIQRVTLTDFRAFPGPTPVTFDLDGKNLLVYGENGAGKSSLFHALRDFFALDSPGSMAKRLAAQKNLFSDADANTCAVEVTIAGMQDEELPFFTDVARWFHRQHPVTSTRLLSEDGRSTGLHKTVNQMARDAARRSAFLDYKSLLDTNYKHGAEEVNLFDLAVSALLADFRVTVSGGKESTISELWLAIKRAEADALLGTRSTKKEQKVRDACVAFNVAFRSALERLLPSANDILRALGWSNVELTGLNSPGVTYQTAHLRRARKLDGLSLRPDIRFRGKPLDRPQLFLNEARLSGLALALYLGGRLACVPSGETQALKLLVLDDVLVGLDHSNRLPVLDVLASAFADWQVVLLTHDRNWFELTKQWIAREHSWTCYEVFEGDPAATAPIPILRKSASHPAPALAQKAKDLLAAGYLEGAANYIRQAFESAIRGACEAKGIKVPYKQPPRHQSSEPLLQALMQWNGSKGHPKPEGWTELLKRLEAMRKIVMNPYSHPSAPNIPKQEIQRAIDAVEEFLTLAKKNPAKSGPEHA